MLNIRIVGDSTGTWSYWAIDKLEINYCKLKDKKCDNKCPEGTTINEYYCACTKALTYLDVNGKCVLKCPIT